MNSCREYSIEELRELGCVIKELEAMGFKRKESLTFEKGTMIINIDIKE